MITPCVRALARFCLPAAFCLIAATAAHADSRAAIPSLQDDERDFVCPKGLTLDAWKSAPTLWRAAYQRCTPKGAPTRYEASERDMEMFVKRLGSPYARLGGYERLVVAEWDRRTCRINILLKTHTVTEEQARIITKDAVAKALLFFETNGRDPAEEKLVVSAGMRAYTKENEVAVYAIYNNKTGEIYHKTKPWR